MRDSSKTGFLSNVLKLEFLLVATSTLRKYNLRHTLRMQHCLYLRPLPQGQIVLRPTLFPTFFTLDGTAIPGSANYEGAACEAE
jgi:hypothetical protein